MTETENYCFNCIHWEIEPGTLDKPHKDLIVQVLVFTYGLENVTPEMIDRGVSMGICRAFYTDQYGVPHQLEMTTTGMTPCLAKDDLGQPLFSPVPEG